MDTEFIGIRSELKQVKISEVIKMKPVKDQFQDGTHLVNNNRVKQLKKNLDSVLKNPTNPITVNSKGRILVGNHRRAALEEAVKEGFDGNRTISVLFLKEATTKEQDSKNVIDNNWNNNTTNKIPHLIYSELPASKKILAPAVQAFKTANTTLNKSFLEHMGIRVGSVINANPGYFLSIKDTGRASIGMIDLYESKGNKDTKLSTLTSFHSEDVNVDLNEIVEELSVAVFPGLSLIARLKEKGIWKEKLGNNKMLGYYILSLSISGRLVTGESTRRTNANQINFGQFERALKENGTKVFNAARTINDNSKASLDSLEGVFFPSK